MLCLRNDEGSLGCIFVKSGRDIGALAGRTCVVDALQITCELQITHHKVPQKTE
jgi:hypothetical protein